ncbi:uncharacterized protein LOC126705022 [Quercus robur]|uniref:uncharacterized protein LOC126705022 n=1 Tax=Quercus robur TaxID=38942 RepID=UPI00216316DF|nr:uncharacterized protein LOC126705022 [Quercus robur]
MEEFCNVLLQSDLIDLGFYGNKFTWRNSRSGEAFVEERLDRACATIEWRALFPSSKVVHLQASYSDNVPIMLTTNVDTQIACRKKIPRRFEEKWVTHPECEGIIHEAWNGEISMGSPIYRLFEKIKKSHIALVGWSRQLGYSKTKLEEKESKQETLIAMNYVDNLDVIQRVKDEINALLL